MGGLEICLHLPQNSLVNTESEINKQQMGVFDRVRYHTYIHTYIHLPQNSLVHTEQTTDNMGTRQR